MKLTSKTMLRAACAVFWLSTLVASPAWAKADPSLPLLQADTELEGSVRADAAPVAPALANAVPTSADPTNTALADAVPAADTAADTAPVDAAPPKAASSGAAPTARNQDTEDVAPPQTEVTVSTTGTAAVRVLSQHDAAVTVGEPVQLRVRVSLPEGGQLIAVRPSANPFVEAVGDTRRSATSEPTLNVTVFRPGSYSFEVEALWIDAGGKQRKTRSDALEIRIQSVIANEAAPTLAPPGPYQTLRSRNLWLIGGSIAALAIALMFGLWMLWRHLQRPALEEAPPTPLRPAWEVALEQIAALRNDPERMQREPIEFHQRVSDILREWIERRFEIAAPEMTSSEILHELRPRRLHLGQWIDEIQEILADTDLVKFAKFSPPLEGSVRLLEQLEQLVLDVKQADLSPPPAVPAPIESEVEEVAPAVAAAPQLQRPGNPEPAYTPPSVERKNVVRIDFGRSGAEEDDS